MQKEVVCEFLISVLFWCKGKYLIVLSIFILHWGKGNFCTLEDEKPMYFVLYIDLDCLISAFSVTYMQFGKPNERSVHVGLHIFIYLMSSCVIMYPSWSLSLIKNFMSGTRQSLITLHKFIL